VSDRCPNASVQAFDRFPGFDGDFAALVGDVAGVRLVEVGRATDRVEFGIRQDIFENSVFV
jgi:hypothetical protein